MEEINRINKAKEGIKLSLANKSVIVPDDVKLDEYYKYVDQIEASSGGRLQEKTVDIYSPMPVVIVPDEGYDGFSKLTINRIDMNEEISAEGDEAKFLYLAVWGTSSTTDSYTCLRRLLYRNGPFLVGTNSSITNASFLDKYHYEYIVDSPFTSTGLTEVSYNEKVKYIPRSYKNTKPLRVNIPHFKFWETVDMKIETTISNIKEVNFYINGEPATEYTSTVGSIPDYRFTKTNLTSADLTSASNIGNYAFYACSDLESIKVPNARFGGYVFAYCPKLTSADLREVTSLGTYMFQSSGLTEVILGENLQDVSNTAFYAANSLNKITCYATTAPAIHSNSFYGIAKNGVLRVPEGSDYSSWLSYLSTWSIEYF